MTQDQAAEPVVDVRQVSFDYAPMPGRTPVLEDISLQVEARDFLGLIGPNGGGKTTLLKLLLGLLKPQRGKITVMGKSPTRCRRAIGYVPQHSAIDEQAPASVLDIVLTGRLHRSSWGLRFRRDDRDAAMRALARTQCDALASKPFTQLSGGQRQRVLIARALAGDAKLLLLDEPTAGVDAHIQSNLTDLLHELNEHLTIIMVSHDISLVSAHLKTVACLNHRLTWHRAGDVTEAVIVDAYQQPMRLMHHDHDCPVGHPHAPGNPGNTGYPRKPRKPGSPGSFE